MTDPDFLATRRSFRDPIPEIFLAAEMLHLSAFRFADRLPANAAPSTRTWPATSLAPRR